MEVKPAQHTEDANDNDPSNIMYTILATMFDLHDMLNSFSYELTVQDMSQERLQVVYAINAPNYKTLSIAEHQSALMKYVQVRVKANGTTLEGEMIENGAALKHTRFPAYIL